MNEGHQGVALPLEVLSIQLEDQLEAKLIGHFLTVERFLRQFFEIFKEMLFEEWLANYATKT